jgi:hypothetical protein
MTALASVLTKPSRAVRRVTWTNQADAQLIHLRGEGASIRTLATTFSLSRSTIAMRAVRLGLVLPTKLAAPAKTDPTPDPARDPLPAGHPISWGLITAGTALEGAAYEIPDSHRLRRASAFTEIIETAETAA